MTHLCVLDKLYGRFERSFDDCTEDRDSLRDGHEQLEAFDEPVELHDLSSGRA
jgi:hypothetical protein